MGNQELVGTGSDLQRIEPMFDVILKNYDNMLYWYSSTRGIDPLAVEHIQRYLRGNHNKEHQLTVVLTLQEVI
jgi:hypothetical protein